MKRALKIIIPIVILLAITGVSVFTYIRNRVPDNELSVIGNTAGNLNSGGIFCEHDGRIYFSNPYNKNFLYSMTPDCSDIRLVAEDCASYINAAGNFLYYVKKNDDLYSETSVLRGQIYGVMRMNLLTSNKSNLSSEYSTDLSLTGNTLLYNAVDSSNTVTYAVDIQGSKAEIISRNDYNNACVANGNLYYSDDIGYHRIYSMNTETGVSTLLLDENTYMANLVDGYLYYIDLEHNQSLNRINMSTYEKTVLTTDHCILYNVYNGIVYYQAENTTHALMRMNADGSNPVVVFQGDVTSISCTSQYTFFQVYGSDSLFRTPTFADPAVQTFFIEAI